MMMDPMDMEGVVDQMRGVVGGGVGGGPDMPMVSERERMANVFLHILSLSFPIIFISFCIFISFF